METYLDFHLFSLAGTQITVGTCILFGLVLTATFLISRLMQQAAHKAFELRGVRDEGTLGVSRRLIHYAVLLVGSGIALQLVGIDLGTMLTAGALFAVGVGFALQNIVQNFVSGVILLIERAIKPSDILEVDGRFVRVVQMGIRATVGRTLDEEEIIIPNSILVQNTVKNFTLRDSSYRLRTLVGVVYSSDMRLVRQTLEGVAEDLPWRDQKSTPRILMKEFANSSVNFEVSVWIEDPWQAQMRISELNEAIWWSLKDAGIIIAFPQLDVHFDPPVVDSMQALMSSAGH